MERLEKLINLEKCWWAILIIFLAPTFWALFIPGFFGVSDDLHVAWLHQMDKALRSGQIPPRYVPDLSYGFGYPLFNFVFPLPFYIGEIFHLMGLSLVDSVKLVFLVSIIGAGFSMYLLMKALTTPTIGLLGAVLYAYAPYRALDIYVRGAIGEALAFVFLPLVCLSLVHVIREKRFNYKWVGIGGLGLGGLILTHNITTYMFLPFLFGLGFLLIFFKYKFLDSAINSGIMLTIGLLIAGYFWIPALLDSSLMKYDTVFNFIDHFPTIKQLIIPYWGYGASVPGPYDGMSFNVGIVNLLVLCFSAAVFIKRYKYIDQFRKLILIWVYLSILITVFMMNHRSSFIWNNLPLLPYFQFPWRFLIMTTFLIPLSLVAIDNLRFKKTLTLGAFLIVAAGNFSYFKPSEFLYRLDNYYLNKYVPVPVASLEYQKTQEEYLRLTKYTQTRPEKKYPVIMFGADKVLAYANDFNYRIKTKSIDNFELGISKYYFPGWEAEVDGAETKIFPGRPFGQISINVPAGEHEVIVFFKETPVKMSLDIISVVGVLIAGFFIWRSKSLIKK